MIHFILVEPVDDTFKSLNKIYKAKDALKAAKKAYRDNKNLEVVYLYNKDNKTVHKFTTETFFTKKKPHKKN